MARSHGAAMKHIDFETFRDATKSAFGDVSDAARGNKKVLEHQNSVVVRLRAGAGYFRRIYERLVRSDGKNTHFDGDRETLITELNFFRDRDAEKQEATERLIACDLLVKDEYPLNRILSETDDEASMRLYDELTQIENIRFSQLATLSYSPGESFEEQSGLTRLLLAKFLTIKAYLCHTKGLTLNTNNYEDHFLDHTEIRLEDIQRRMHQLFNEARAVGEHNPEAFEAFKDNMAALTTGATETIDIPSEAPEIYRKRQKREIDGVLRKETPEEFTRRVYKKWLGRGLLRPDVRILDKGLYEALYKYGYPDDFDTLLPTARGRRSDLPKRSDRERLQSHLDSQRRFNQKRSKLQID